MATTAKKPVRINTDSGDTTDTVNFEAGNLKKVGVDVPDEAEALAAAKAEAIKQALIYG